MTGPRDSRDQAAGQSLRDRVRKAPHPHDRERAQTVIGQLDPHLSRGPFGEVLCGAAGSSPYLARLLTRHGDWLAQFGATAPEDALDDLITAASADREQSFKELSAALRTAKSRAALLIALADLGGVWSLSEVTGALTALADASVEVAARWLLRQEIATGRLPGLQPEALDQGAGYIVLAMGKMGAGELNYSSDIDLIALFDNELFPGADALDARTRYIHVTRQLVKLLSENTADGYVFRTDLRLRPAPSTTPVCMATEAAERYYESAGRTWERAAYIKARPLVDRGAGDAFLQALTPFVWRRHLDFAAVEDIHGMLRKIRAQRARLTPSGLPGHDLKVGLGGIREIEFFAQTRQLIMGGRDVTLRPRTTLGALQALAAAGWIDGPTRDALSEDYEALRTIEHRLQMIEDTQTQTIPKPLEARKRLAALSGFADLAAFESDLAERLARVHALCEDFFGKRIAPGTTASRPHDEEALTKAGFERPTDALRVVSRWRRGELPATRSERAQTLIAGLEGRILERIAGAASPDHALAQFDRFLSGLPAGVQVFSLFAANPQLLDLIVEICSAAPRLAGYLARHPQTLDALLDQGFWQPLPALDVLDADLRLRLVGIDDYERALDATRRWSREQWFRAGVHVLRGLAAPSEAGLGFSNIAEVSIAQLLPWVVSDFAQRHGPPPGNGLAVLAMGKLGSREMTAGSDLDMITIFDEDGAENSEGPKPLPAGMYYRRLTQSLVAALTAPTAEGALYEVDMRLRPSGRSGPVAVSLAAFERYQMNDAWVWEHLALTRARTVAGPSDLCDRIQRITVEALGTRARDPDGKVMAEAHEMRERLIGAHGADRGNPWSLKHAAGGLMEIEFLAQVGALIEQAAPARPTDALVTDLAKAGWLAADEATELRDTARLLQSLQHVERVALEAPLTPDGLGAELRQVLARSGGAEDFEDLEARLRRAEVAAAAIASRYLD